MIDRGKLMVLLAVMVLVVTMVARRAVKEASVVKVKTQPSAPAVIAVKEQAFEEKPAIKPIVIKEQGLQAKPYSSDPEAWDSYSKKVFSELKAAMSNEMSEKISQELDKRKNPEVEKNLERLDEEIKMIQEEVSENPNDEYNNEKLMKLLEVRSKYKYLQETFIK